MATARCRTFDCLVAAWVLATSQYLLLLGMYLIGGRLLGAAHRLVVCCACGSYRLRGALLRRGCCRVLMFCRFPVRRSVLRRARQTHGLATCVGAFRSAAVNHVSTFWSSRVSSFPFALRSRVVRRLRAADHPRMGCPPVRGVSSYPCSDSNGVRPGSRLTEVLPAMQAAAQRSVRAAAQAVVVAGAADAHEAVITSGLVHRHGQRTGYAVRASPTPGWHCVLHL